MKDRSDDPSHHEERSYHGATPRSPFCIITKIKVNGNKDRSFTVDPFSLFRSSQCSTTGVTKAVVCAILSGIVHIKEPLLIVKSSPCGGSGFPLATRMAV